MSKTIQINNQSLKMGFSILKELSVFRPYSSISFQSSEEIIIALEEVKRLADWGMAKNKHKMKDTAIKNLELILNAEPGEPVNLNLTKYELKSIKAVSKLVKRTLDERKKGVVLS